MLGKQIKIKLITLCDNCHKEIHKKEYGGFSNGNNDNVNWELIKKKRQIENKLKREMYNKNVLNPYLESIVGKIMLTKEDRGELINKLNFTDSRNRKQKNISKLNCGLEEINSEYRIKQFETSRMIDGKKKKFKSAWKIIILNN